MKVKKRIDNPSKPPIEKGGLMGNSALPFHWYDAKLAYLRRVAKFCAIFLMRIMGIMRIMVFVLFGEIIIFVELNL